jgi:hypothetical protein
MTTALLCFSNKAGTKCITAAKDSVLSICQDEQPLLGSVAIVLGDAEYEFSDPKIKVYLAILPFAPPGLALPNPKTFPNAYTTVHVSLVVTPVPPV